MHPSSSARKPRSEDRIEKAAGDWLARRDRGFTAEEASAFTAWEAADPRHAIEFARIASTWITLDTADEAPQIMALSREMDEAIERRNVRRRRALWVLGFAAAAAVAVGLLVPGQRLTAPEKSIAANTCRVIPSSARQLALPDGSMVDLNADTLVEPAFTARERRIRLVRGEAHFTVTKDPARPFVVAVGNVTFCAVGTAFNVRVDQAAVQLLVTEGTVRVEPASAQPDVAAKSPLVFAGQRLVVEAGQNAAPVAVGRPEPVTREELARSLAWKESQLVFDRTPLSEAVAAFNRLNTHQLVVADPILAARRLGGTFQASNIEGFVLLLESGFDVSVNRGTSGKTILRGRE